MDELDTNKQVPDRIRHNDLKRDEDDRVECGLVVLSLNDLIPREPRKCHVVKVGEVLLTCSIDAQAARANRL